MPNNQTNHAALLTESEIRKYLLSGKIGGSFEIHDEIESTNTRARDLALQGAAHGTVVLARCQSAGRGRFDRKFYSPDASGLYMSVILRPEVSPEQATLLTPMLAVAVARAMEKAANVQAQIKWVNDVYINGKKACGILCESKLDFQSGRVQHIVAGIGVNVGCMDFPPELSDIATSISNECGQEISRSRFCAELINEINALYPHLETGAFMDEYRSRSNVIGRNVIVLRGDERYPAKAVDIDNEGRLVVENENGEKTVLHSGEISLRFS